MASGTGNGNGSGGPDISVIIPTFNEEEHIAACLKSLQAQTLPRRDFEIIVVDGGSVDKTREIAAAYADKVVRFSEEGVGPARNAGLKIARGAIIATTDADARAPPHWLERIAWHFNGSSEGMNPPIVAVVGHTVPLEKNLKSMVAHGYMQALQLIATFFGKNPGTPGPNTAARRDVLLEIGGWRDLPYCDDLELSMRLVKKGRLRYDPSLEVAASTRRFEIEGYVKTINLWFFGTLRLLLRRPLKDVKYFRKYKSWAYPSGYKSNNGTAE